YTATGFPVYPAFFRQQWADYEAALLAAGASCKALNSAFLGEVYHQIEDVVQVGTPPALYMKSTGHGFTTRTRVRIHGVKLISKLTNQLIPGAVSGLFTVTPPPLSPAYPPPDWFVVPAYVDVPFVYLGPGKVNEGFNTIPGAWAQRQSK